VSTWDIKITYATWKWFRRGLQALVGSAAIVHALTAERSNVLPPNGNPDFFPFDHHDVAVAQLGTAPQLHRAVDVDFPVLDELLRVPAVLGELSQLEELS
jgi:hypothetical protein